MLNLNVKCANVTSTMSLPKCYIARVDAIVSTTKYPNVGLMVHACVTGLLHRKVTSQT